MSEQQQEVTQLLNLAKDGAEDFDAGRLYEMVFSQMHQIAESLYRRERADHTLQPTILVNEAFMSLIGQDHIDWKSRAHFFAVGAQAIRRILIQHARKKHALKRGGDYTKVELDKAVNIREEEGDQLLAIEEALKELELVHERQAKVVEMKFFADMKMEEIATALGVSKRTVEVDWTVARAWLKRYMAEQLLND
ncbi:ECF-type sigma factor [Persicobacter psychrovividus]|uniref:Extracytoplasmic sigma factor ECF n=1 Tax=Persicobacter psychrovividus TaxID=387638 RepID=A0ABM7VF49_9BACT|nr:extracytoplasmic sigma factor ECF [Persicobacter psychrovividus]